MTFRHLADMTSGYYRAERSGTHWAYNDYAIKLYAQLGPRVGCPLIALLGKAEHITQKYPALHYELMNGVACPLRQGPKCHIGNPFLERSTGETAATIINHPVGWRGRDPTRS